MNALPYVITPESPEEFNSVLAMCNKLGVIDLIPLVTIGSLLARLDAATVQELQSVFPKLLIKREEMTHMSMP